jgi:xanthine/CO dehydrogenase XdhC/CoxF family maturation factor
VENEVYDAAQDVLRGGAPRLLTYGISDDLALTVGLPCGGEIDVWVDEPDPELLDRLAEHDVASVRVACTHGLFSGDAIERLSAEKDIEEIVCTNTVPIAPQKATDKLTVLSVAPALAEAMRRIHNGESVSALFA